MAAPTYGAAGTYFEGDSSAPAYGAPAGVVANSVVILFAYVDGVTAPTITLPGGFAHAEGSPVYVDNPGGVTQNHRLVVAWHRASGSESGPYTMTLSATLWCPGQVLRYDGVVTSGTPFDSPTATAGVDETNSTTTAPVSITTAGADRLLIHSATNWAGGTWTPPTGFTRRIQGGFGHVTAADLAQAAAGSTGSLTATCSSSDKSEAWLGALIPAGGGGATAIPGRPQPYVPRRRAATW